MEILILFAVVFAALIMELIDAGLGMGYGTVLSPLLIAFGYSPLLVVPSILFSQAIGGFTAAMFHHQYGNVDFKPKSTDIKKIKKALKELGYVESFKRGFSNDFKIAFAITFFGVITTILGAFIAVNIPKTLLKAYIGILVLAVGYLLIFKKQFKFSWKKMAGVGFLASFNKGISGGGFGPVTTGGQIIAGNKHKSSVGCTTLSEAPICIAGFLTYLILNGLTDYTLVVYLSIGAFIGAPFGALLTRNINSDKLRYYLGMFIIALGGWTLIKLLI